MKINHKFKVGDKVRFISKDSPNAYYFKCPVDNLEIKELTKNEYDYRVYEQDKSSSWGVNEEELELIPETYKYEVVHTETQEQWDFVYRKTNSTISNNWLINKEYTGFCINRNEYCSITWYREQNSKIYSFEEWLDKFGHKSEYLKQNQKEEQWIPQVGDYVITRGYSGSYDGRILKITKIDSNRYYYFEVFDKGFYDKNHNFSKKSILRKALPHEIPTQELSKEDLLAEAKRRFPIGTKFIDADFGDEVEVMKNDHTVVTEDKKIQSINVHTTRGKKGKLTYNDVYKEGTWAEIVKEPKITEKSLTESLVHSMQDDFKDLQVKSMYFGKALDWSQVLRATGELSFGTPSQKPVKNNKILPIKVRNSNITEPTELPKRTRIKIIKKQLLTI